MDDQNTLVDPVTGAFLITDLSPGVVFGVRHIFLVSIPTPNTHFELFYLPGGRIGSLLHVGTGAQRLRSMARRLNRAR